MENKNIEDISSACSDESIFTPEQLKYAHSVDSGLLRSHLLYQVRLRDNMEADRNAFEKDCNMHIQKVRELLQENTQLKERIAELKKIIEVLGTTH
jgi:hypothetical protein